MCKYFLILIILWVIFDFKTNFQFEKLYEIYKENGIIDQQCAHEHHMSLHQNMASMTVLVGKGHWWLHDFVIEMDSS